MKQSILVLGAYGMLGTSLHRRLVEQGHTVLCQGRGPNAQVVVNPADATALLKLLFQHPVGTIVNLIAATNVDQCEVNPQDAYRANVQVVESVVHAVCRSGYSTPPHLVQLSTDQVYEGPGPHIETHVDPCNVYALSKFAGELTASKIGATVLRTNFFGRSRCVSRPSLSDWIVSSLRTGQGITVFEDVLFSALHIDTLCMAIEVAVRSRRAGIFNVGCRDGASKAHLAIGLARRLELDSELMTVGKASDKKLRARRPLDMRMDSTHFEQTFNFKAPTFESQIDLAAQEYMHE